MKDNVWVNVFTPEVSKRAAELMFPETQDRQVPLLALGGRRDAAPQQVRDGAVRVYPMQAMRVLQAQPVGPKLVQGPPAHIADVDNTLDGDNEEVLIVNIPHMQQMLAGLRTFFEDQLHAYELGHIAAP